MFQNLLLGHIKLIFLFSKQKSELYAGDFEVMSSEKLHIF